MAFPSSVYAGRGSVGHPFAVSKVAPRARSKRPAGWIQPSDFEFDPPALEIPDNDFLVILSFQYKHI